MVVGASTLVTCKFCKTPQPNHRELRFHCELEHPGEFASVMGWLEKTVQPRLATFEKLAAEGMRGPDE